MDFSYSLHRKLSAQLNYSGMAKRLKKWTFWLLLFVPVLVAIETASYTIIKRTIPSRILVRAQGGEALARVRQTRQAMEPPRLVQAGATKHQTDTLVLFHPVLGWDYPPRLVYKDAKGVSYSHGSQGERRCSTEFDTTLIATYGDSFTYCDEVGDANTWQTFLAEKLQTNVLNFGVCGHGPDQALLKYELHEETRAKVVILGVMPENINRVVNIYRPFYTHTDPVRGTKPIFFKDKSKIRLIPNPITSVAELSRLDQEQFLEELGKFDYWYQLDKSLPKFSFPYTLSFYGWRDKAFAQLAARVQGSFKGRVRHPWNLYEEEGPLSIMCYIADRFVASARSRGAEPLIVIMPHSGYVNEITDDGMVRAANFVEYLAAKGYPFLDAVQSVADMRPSKQDLDNWYQGHATAEGNRVVAEILNRYLHANYSCLKRGHGTNL
jgi:hypothetical protein